MKASLKLIRSTFKIIQRNAYLSLIQVPIAILSCIVFLPRKDTHYVVICDHIGDFAITMGYLKEFRCQNSYPHITVCTVPKFARLLSLYPNICDRVVKMEKKQLYRILRLSSTNFGAHALAKLGNITLVNPANAFTEEFFDYIARYPQIRFKDCIQYGCLGISPKAEFCAPALKTKMASCFPREFIPGKTVLISPFSRALFLEQDRFFLDLVNHLKRKGYQVFTNLSEPEQAPLPGTLAAYYSLTEICTFVMAGGFFVGARSGLCDLLAYVECKLVAIYPYASPYFDFFDIQALPAHKAETMQIRQTKQINDDIQKIIDFFQGGHICP